MSARDAVRRLALTEGPDHRATVAAAAAATRDVERAAAFVSGGGLARLDCAIAAAERADDAAAARAGRLVGGVLAPLSPRPRNGFTRRRRTT
ncbi:MAG: hypothetical protein ABEH78_05595 [Haloferacaceae archaeon]